MCWNYSVGNNKAQQGAHIMTKERDKLNTPSGSVIARLVEAANEVQRTYPTLGFLCGQEMKDALDAGNELQQAIRAAENLLSQNH